VAVRLTAAVESTVRRYVLGDLDEGLRDELDELLVTDPDAYDALSVIEDDLIEEYLDEIGTQAERQGFEQHFLASADGARRLAFARALRARASARAMERQPEKPTAPVPPPQPTAWQPAWLGLAAALAVSLLANAWLASQHQGRGQRAASTLPVAPTAQPSNSSSAPPVAPSSSPTPSATTAAEHQDLMARLEAEQVERSKAEARSQTLEQQLRARGPRIATFALAAGLLRGEGSLPRVSVPSGAVVVGLRLELPGNDYPRYRAALLDANGEEIWAASGLRAEGGVASAVVCLLPTGLLPRGDYQVKLSGLGDGAEPEAVGTYAFRVSAP
jgi:hypothetical protein